MKAFLLSIVVAIGLAMAARFVLTGSLAQSADHAFATASVRVGESGSIDERGWR